MKNRRSVFYKCSAVLLCFFMLVQIMSVSVYADDSKQKVVKVGWYEDAYHITGKNGNRSGYGYEYEQAVSAYTGWKYEYVKGEWSKLLEMLQNGQIDMMGALSYTDERAENMLYSELPMGTEKYYLYADLVHTDISASNLSSLNGKRITMLENSVQRTQFEDWEAKHNIQTQPVFAESFDEGKQQAKKRQTDGVISTETPEWVEFGMSAIATVGGSDIYYCINKNRPDLKEELDNAMRKMENDKPFYADELYQRYLSAASVSSLSNDEQDWLKQHGAIRVGYLKNDCSVSKVDQDTHKVEGIINDYIKYAKNCLDNQKLEFKLVQFDSQEKQQEALKKGKIDIIFHSPQNPCAAEQNGFILSNTVFTASTSAVTTKNRFNENNKNKVAIEKGNIISNWYISYNYPSWKIKEYDTFKDCEKAVENGEVDCLVAQSGQLSYYINKNKFHVVLLSKTANTSFATNRENTVLLSILNKTLKTMPENMLSGALSMYDNTLKKVTLMDFIRDNLPIVFMLIAFIFIVVFSMFIKAKKSEEKAKKFAFELQESQHDLQTALVRAEKANTAKTTFLHNMSHDIRTPMNAIMGFVNIAKKKVVSDDVKVCLDKIGDSSDLLLTLINDVLDISLIESGKTKYTPSPVNLVETTDISLNVVQGLLSGRNIDFKVERNIPDNPHVLADSVRIREILVNILSNAVKFTNDGGTIKFISDYKVLDENHIEVHYTISDTGIGMSEEFMEHIFDEFSQENSGARTHFKGTGLGMAITKSYLDLMGGKILVESEKDKGSTFYVTIPFEKAKNIDVNKDKETTNIKDLSNIHVLLAEDNDLNAEIATIQLEEFDMKVTRVENGQVAIDAFKDNPPGTFDIILMDIMMPVMDGYEATKAIRNISSRKDGQTIPIIAMTANAFAEDVQASLEAGMNYHITKPIEIDELIKAIKRNINS